MSKVRFFGISLNKDSILNLNLFLLTLAIAMLAMANPALAAGGLDNLNKATDALQELVDWLYIFVGVGAILYLTWLVIMALMEKKQWSDVFMGIGYCAVAGGIVMAGDWGLELFK
ncbi:TrbC/VirB2 family protein [Providencia rettgeri]|uniref:TrbC/VirB2 family protein n=1 Tax=Providencia rettgeri TaxID=587 RepID=UPI0024BAE2E1|nr:TrbC/VirB2 family protein [Providencia rettgeri]WHT81965.1 TrbC/VirB2 family protein [Providencia rettgeri]